MNAYELAKLMLDVTDCESSEYYQAGMMLKQQADRIAELEKQGEPVAWMQMHHKDNVPTKFSPVKVWEDDIPLYTTPQTKPLSDDDVEEFEWMLKKYFNYKPDEPAPNLNRIIRTIEARVRGDK